MKLILVRHGDYDQDLQLSNFGRNQMSQLAERLRRDIDGVNTRLMSSPADRAIESAKVIGEALNLEVEEHEILWSDNTHPEDVEGVLQLISSHEDGTEVLILVTHFEYLLMLPFAYGMKIFSPSVEKGEALIIDRDQERVVHLDPLDPI